MALEGKDVVVVESSEWASKWMQEAYGERKGFKIIDTNFEKMDKSLLGGQFDFIFANHVFEHLVDPMTAIEFCYEKLNKNGKFFLIVPNQEREKNMHHTHEWAYSKDCLKLWFEQAGFKNIKFEEFGGSKEELEELGGAHIRIVGEKL
jgi:2-polyprenyl-3-methyl-5-hydroxy-6-metoxy-1,4-benzoquinol methylase